MTYEKDQPINISVWPDDYNGRENRKWIVSHEAGGSYTLDICDSMAEAMIRAKKIAAGKKLPVLSQTEPEGHWTEHRDHLLG
ncbi:MAG: hypothetical protein KGJ13_12645 [Patescibacteria group bacterium]|nr:hypothetical protein [Patescibacteria group bacterium]